MLNLGIVKPGSTLYFPFDSFKGSDGSSITLTGLAVTDIEIYKDGSVTQRGSDSGYTLLDTDGIDLDGITGIHGLSIDLADNTTAGFYASGSKYWIVVSSVTIDAVTVNFILGYFEIGQPAAILNTTIATLATQTSFTLTSGPAEDDALNGTWAVIHDVASAVQLAKVLILDYTGSTKTVTLVAGGTFTAAETDNFSVMDMAPMQPATLGRNPVVDAAGLVDANAVKLDGDATAAANLSNVYTAFETGTAQAGGASTITLRAGASATNDFFKDQAVFIVGGTGAGQTNRISTYVGATKVATVTTAWVTVPDATSVYVVIGRIG
jgi:hypothetical protein